MLSRASSRTFPRQCCYKEDQHKPPHREKRWNPIPASPLRWKLVGWLQSWERPEQGDNKCKRCRSTWICLPVSIILSPCWRSWLEHELGTTVKQYVENHYWPTIIYDKYRSLGVPWAPTSSWWPFGLLDFFLHTLWAVRLCGHSTQKYKNPKKSSCFDTSKYLVGQALS